MSEEQKLNIELFRKMRRRIADVPDSYDQSMWATRTKRAPCGTAACLAGEAIICSQPSVREGIELLWEAMWDAHTPSPDTLARKLLGLNQQEASVMFLASASGWPEPFALQFQRARTNKGRAQAAVAYLDHIIETGKVLE